MSAFWTIIASLLGFISFLAFCNGGNKDNCVEMMQLAALLAIYAGVID